MPCAQCVGIERRFDRKMARRQLRRYRKRGPSKTTRRLLASIVEVGAKGRSFLDIGGGVGALQHGLMKAGATGGTASEVSVAYLEAARDEATAQGHADLIVYVDGDFVEIQDRVEPADIVTLDRVICCYHDMPALVDASASRALRVYGLVYPRDTRLMRVAIGLVNLLHWLRRHPFRAYVHPTEAVEARIEEHGLTHAWRSSTLLWQIAVFSRPHPPPTNGR